MTRRLLGFELIKSLGADSVGVVSIEVSSNDDVPDVACPVTDVDDIVASLMELHCDVPRPEENDASAVLVVVSAA